MPAPVLQNKEVQQLKLLNNMRQALCLVSDSICTLAQENR